MMPFRTSTVAVIAAVLVACSGCSGDATRSGAPSSTQTTAPGSAPAPRADEDWAGGTIPITERLWDWSVVTEASQQFRGELEANADYVVAAADTGHLSEAIDRGSGEHIVTVSPPEGFKVEDLNLSDRWLTWRAVEVAPAGNPRVKLFVADLDTAAVRSVGNQPNAHEPGLPPTTAVHDDTLAYTTQEGGDTNCLARLNMVSMESELAYCTPRKSMGVGFPRVTAYGVTFALWRPRPQPDGCSTVQVLRAGGELTTIEPELDCWSFSGVAGEDFTFWNEQNSSTPGEAQFYARTSTGRVLSFGFGDTATEVLCDGWAYWVTHPRGTGELRRWKLGEEVEVVYRNTRRWLTLSKPRCQTDRISFLRTPNKTGPVQLVEAVIPASDQ